MALAVWFAAVKRRGGIASLVLVVVLVLIRTRRGRRKRSTEDEFEYEDPMGIKEKYKRTEEPKK